MHFEWNYQFKDLLNNSLIHVEHFSIFVWFIHPNFIRYCWLGSCCPLLHFHIIIFLVFTGIIAMIWFWNTIHGAQLVKKCKSKIFHRNFMYSPFTVNIVQKLLPFTFFHSTRFSLIHSISWLLMKFQMNNFKISKEKKTGKIQFQLFIFISRSCLQINNYIQGKAMNLNALRCPSSFISWK